MRIFGASDAIKWVIENPDKVIIAEGHRLSYSSENKMLVCIDFNHNGFTVNMSEIVNLRAWKLAVDKVSFAELFPDWLDGATIFGEYEGKYYMVDPESALLIYITSSDFSKMYGFVDKVTSKSMFKQPIWWKE